MASNSTIIPALQPPQGVKSNFTNPESIQPAIIAGLSVCLAISTLTGILRLYAQYSLFKRFVWADAWMLLGWLFSVGFAAFLYACIPYGAGRHQWDVTASDYNHISFLLFIDFILYDIAILGPKVAILLQLKNIFAPHNTHNRFYWLSLFLIGINIIFYIALSFALLFQCQPVAKGWDPNIPGKCLDQNSMLESSGPFNIVSDFLIFLLPITAVWSLQLPVRTRMAVGSAFAVGLFGCICSAVRLYYSNQLSSSGDATYLIFQNQLWANAEIVIGLLISNIIILPRFIRHKRGIESSRSYMYNSHNKYGNSRTVSQNRKSYPANVQTSEPYVKLNETPSLALPPSQSTSEWDVQIPIQRYPSAEESPTNHHAPPRGGITRTVEFETTTEPARAHVPDPVELYQLGIAK